MSKIKRVTLTESEANYVKENFMAMSAAQMAQVLKMSPAKVRFNVITMGLKKYRRSKPIQNDDTEHEFWNDQLHSRYFNF